MSADGGPAFPAEVDGSNCWVQVGDQRFRMPGMSLRDYFAAKAMGGFMATYQGADSTHPAVNPNNAKELSALSYVIADAMLVARAGVTGGKLI